MASLFSRFFLALLYCYFVSEAAGAKVCSSAPYKELLFLSSYAPAKSYCTAHYPLPTVTVTVTGTAPKMARAVTSTTSAAAAKVAGNDAAWSSLLVSAKAIVSTLCSCIETPPTKTKTVPPKATATACNPGHAQPTFILQASGSGTIDDGRWALLSNTGDTDFVTFADDVTAATSFTFNDACNLVGYNGEIADTDAGATAETVYFNTPEQIAANNYVPATCNIANQALTCAAQTAKIFYVCPTLLQIQIAVTVPAGCSAMKLKPIYQ